MVLGWLNRLKKSFGLPFLILVVSIYWAQGFRAFPWVGISYLIKDELKLSPAASQLLTSTAFIPWSIKPVYGIFSDCVAIYGARRVPYLIISSILSIAAWGTMAFSDSVLSSSATFTVLLTCQNVGAALADVVVDAMIAETATDDREEFAGDLQALSWFVMALGGVAGSLLGSPGLQLLKPSGMFAVFALFPVSQFISCLLISERSLGLGKGLAITANGEKESTAGGEKLGNEQGDEAITAQGEKGEDVGGSQLEVGDGKGSLLAEGEGGGGGGASKQIESSLGAAEGGKMVKEAVESEMDIVSVHTEREKEEAQTLQGYPHSEQREAPFKSGIAAAATAIVVPAVLTVNGFENGDSEFSANDGKGTVQALPHVTPAPLSIDGLSPRQGDPIIPTDNAETSNEILSPGQWSDALADWSEDITNGADEEGMPVEAIAADSSALRLSPPSPKARSGKWLFGTFGSGVKQQTGTLKQQEVGRNQAGIGSSEAGKMQQQQQQQQKIKSSPRGKRSKKGSNPASPSMSVTRAQVAGNDENKVTEEVKEMTDVQVPVVKSLDGKTIGKAVANGWQGNMRQVSIGGSVDTEGGDTGNVVEVVKEVKEMKVATPKRKSGRRKTSGNTGKEAGMPRGKEIVQSLSSGSKQRQARKRRTWREWWGGFRLWRRREMSPKTEGGLKDESKVVVKKATTKAKEPRKPSLLWREVKLTGSTLLQALRQPSVMRPLIWFMLSCAVIPSQTTVMFYYQTNFLHLDPDFLGTSRVVGWGGLLVGTVLYTRFLKRVRLRVLFCWVHFLLAMCTLSDFLLVRRDNLALNIPDRVWVLGASALTDSIGQLKFMPFLVVSARLCPPGVEGTLFAVFMSAHNLGNTISGYVGATLASYLHVTAESFEHLALGLLIQAGCTLLPILFLFLIPRNITSQGDEKKEHPSGDTQALKAKEE
eukprot:TRINITY_DN2400_c0_g1_i1.p1 TRINITY_DN2400_c0_g1~~TRINITY_DN2400_c0_g1_i1.p1  ORF type:complete len:935 (-),score=190.87 TRINITY_DN2400_c0_g1_i1:791-3595(-)